MARVNGHLITFARIRKLLDVKTSVLIYKQTIYTYCFMYVLRVFTLPCSTTVYYVSILYKLSREAENVNTYRPEVMLRTGPKVKI